MLSKDWADLTEEDFVGLMNCGCRHPDYMKTIAGRELEFQSLSFLNPELTRDGLKKKITELFRDRKYGNIIRVKGFFGEGSQWYQVNATEGEVRIEKAPESRGAIIIIGSGLNEENISILMTGKPPEHRIL